MDIVLLFQPHGRYETPSVTPQQRRLNTFWSGGHARRGPNSRSQRPVGTERERWWGLWGGAASPPPHQLGGLESAVSSPMGGRGGAKGFSLFICRQIASPGTSLSDAYSLYRYRNQRGGGFGVRADSPPPHQLGGLGVL